MTSVSQTTATSPAQTVTEYLTAVTSGDFERGRSLLSDDFSFRGPMMEVSGADRFLAEAAGNYEFVRGLRMLRQWEDAETGDVCSVYELDVETPAAATTMLMSEWNAVRDGRVTSSLLIFDTSVHHELMPEGHDH